MPPISMALRLRRMCCGVMVAATLSPWALQNSTDSSVVMCSMTIFKPGTLLTRPASTSSRNSRSRSNMSTDPWVTSPWTSRTRPCSAMASRAGMHLLTSVTPASELVVAPAGYSLHPRTKPEAAALAISSGVVLSRGRASSGARRRRPRARRRGSGRGTRRRPRWCARGGPTQHDERAAEGRAVKATRTRSWRCRGRAGASRRGWAKVTRQKTPRRRCARRAATLDNEAQRARRGGRGERQGACGRHVERRDGDRSVSAKTRGTFQKFHAKTQKCAPSTKSSLAGAENRCPDAEAAGGAAQSPRERGVLGEGSLSRAISGTMASRGRGLARALTVSARAGFVSTPSRWLPTFLANA